MYRYVGRRGQPLVSVEPARIIRCQNVDIDARAGELAGELQRPLHAGTSSWWEVEGNQQYLHKEALRRTTGAAI
jgi:hypothetical protein